LAKRIANGRNFEKNEKKLTYDLTYKDVVDILEIIDHSTCGELHLELEDLKLTVVKKGGLSLTAAARPLEVRNIQRCGMTAKNEIPSSIKETDDSKKGR
jgi:hypothetical protein